MFEVLLTKLTHEMESAVIVEWLKADGDLVEKGEPLVRVETDKATMDMEADAAGRLAGITVEAGQTVPVGTRLAYLLGDGESLPVDTSPTRPVDTPPTQPTAAAAKATRSPNAPPTPDNRSRPTPVAADDSPRSGGRVVATPIARRLAREHGVDLTQLYGTGPDGRIVEADVRAHVMAVGEGAPAAPPLAGYRKLELSSIQRLTGKRLQASVRDTPTFELEVEIDMSAAASRRAESSKLSYTALVLHATAQALRATKRLNAHYVQNELRGFDAVHLGVAVATEKGLVVPTIVDAEQLDAAGFEAALKRFREQAKTGSFSPTDLSPGTFTVSNLGMFGIDRFRALINPPQVGILAVGRIAERPVVRDAKLLVRPTLHATLTADHRAVDGSTAAPFLVRLREVLEEAEIDAD